MNFYSWGDYKGKFEDIHIVEFLRDNELYEYYIEIIDSNTHSITIMCDDVECLAFTGKSFKGFDSFTRLMNNISLVFREGKLVCKTHTPKVDYIKPISSEVNNDLKLLTLDIETRTINNKMIPYCVCYHDGCNSFSYYLSDYPSIENMLTTCISQILSKKYLGYKIYVHNLSNFDGIFLLRIISKYVSENRKNLSLSITKRESAFISIKI